MVSTVFVQYWPRSAGYSAFSLHADKGAPETSKGFLAVLHFPQQLYQNCVAFQFQEFGCNRKRQYFYTFCFWECWIFDGTTHSISASHAGFGRLMIHYSSNARISLQCPQNLLQILDFPKICPQNSPRCAAVLHFAVFLATSQISFSLRFSPSRGKGTPFLNRDSPRTCARRQMRCQKNTPMPWQNHTFSGLRPFLAP